MDIARSLLLAALAIGAVSPARATTTYGSQAALEGSLPALTFSQFTPTLCDGGSCVVGGFYSTMTDGRITFTGSLNLISTNAIRANAGNLSVTLPNTVVAFGAMLTSLTGLGTGNITFTGDGSACCSGYTPNGSWMFLVTGDDTYFGARVTTGPIPNLVYSITGSAVSISGFETALGIDPAPEPSSLAMLCAGVLLLALGAARRRR
jgi:hypothetical protein